MALARNTDSGPSRRPTLTQNEQRIANAVVDALEPRFAELEQNLDEKFKNHMTEIEGHYSARDEKRDELPGEMKSDIKKILESLDS